GRAEVVRVENAARKLIETGKLRDVRHREVTAGAEDIVNLGGRQRVLNEILDGDGELFRLWIVGHPADRVVELDVMRDAVPLDATLDVVVQHGARRERRDGAAEMLLEGIVGELEAFLGSVRP